MRNTVHNLLFIFILWYPVVNVYAESWCNGLRTNSVLYVYIHMRIYISDLYRYIKVLFTCAYKIFSVQSNVQSVHKDF